MILTKSLFLFNNITKMCRIYIYCEFTLMNPPKRILDRLFLFFIFSHDSMQAAHKTTNGRITLTTDSPTRKKSCNSQKANDILYMVDTTANVTDFWMTKMKSFISYSMNRFKKINPFTMMGIMQFNGQSSVKIIKKLARDLIGANLTHHLEKLQPSKVSKRLTGDALVEAGKTVILLFFFKNKIVQNDGFG